MTTKMISEWYGVSQEVIRDNIRRNREELRNNGMGERSYSEIKELIGSEKISRPKIKKFGINTARETNIFSKRAVLNIGMLLRDSEIAKQVRTTLLDQQEQLTNEEKTFSISEEQLLLLNIIQSPSAEKRAVALAEYDNYKNRHINKLEEEIEEQKPMVEKYGVFMDNDSTFTFTDFAKMISTRAKKDGIILPMSSIKLTRTLRKNGILSKERNRNGFKNLPNKDYEKYFNVSSVEIKNGQVTDSFLKTQTRVNVKGVEFLYEFVKEKLMNG